MIKAVVGMGSCGIAAGAEKVYNALLRKNEGFYELGTAGCIGMCFLEPIVDLYENGELRMRLVKVSEKDTGAIASAMETGVLGTLNRLLPSDEDAAFLSSQTRVVLKNCGITDPNEIESAIACGTYEALKKALLDMKPEEIIDELKLSGLAGRGGAGFPTWKKMQLTAAAEDKEKYLICNADEGDPGAFMDRAVIESDPHTLLEGMLIAAYAIGAQKAIVYIRKEYPLALMRLKRAISQAREKGFIGENIFGSSFSCDIRVYEGAGAFVCGEETALLASLEGRRGVPSFKPPYPSEQGYKGHPSEINNVETLSNLPWIIINGAEAFAAIGSAGNSGTKVFALAGKIKKGGLVEVPLGTTLRELIFNIGGGVQGGKAFKAVQIGGPSGGCLPEYLLDTPIEYEALKATGAIMGSGGMVVVDEDSCIVEMARFFLHFTLNESCGKCVPCRLGSKRVYNMLVRITEGKGADGDIETLERLCHTVQENALCGLGQSALNPVLTTLKYFREEYETHIYDKSCPAGQCPALRTYYVIPRLCRNCRLCLKSCPVDCIVYVPGAKYEIIQDSCIKCDACPPFCPFDAIVVLKKGELPNE